MFVACEKGHYRPFAMIFAGPLFFLSCCRVHRAVVFILTLGRLSEPFFLYNTAVCEYTFFVSHIFHP